MASTRIDGKATDLVLRWTYTRLGHCSVVLMCGLVVGCAVNSPNTGTPNGTLSGQALEYGGPLVNGTQAATGIPGHGILITIERGGRSVASSTTASDGRFSFSLPAGMYKITGCIPVTVDVHAGQQAVQDLSCPIK